jgi:hypothetical protein
MLRVLAGHSAYRHIQANGLSPEHISAVFGASGAAKWLTIYGLDCAVFGDWLADSDQPVDLFGTSVGAFKLAAASQQDPTAALTLLADAYIHQYYEGKVTAEQVIAATNKILSTFLGEQGVAEILSNPRFNYHCASVRCGGWLASENASKQKVAMVKAFVMSLLGRRFHQSVFDRTIFHCGEAVNSFSGLDGFTTQSVLLTKYNFHRAILSSGSIPVLMPGVHSVQGAQPGTYRDGGLLDYHAVPSNISRIENGLVLYPHFYSFLKEGWFDKFYPWRRVKPEQLDNAVIIAPSAEFVRSLPGSRIPDRQDFYRFSDNDAERIRRWTEVKNRSLELGEAFTTLARSGDIASRVELLA